MNENITVEQLVNYLNKNEHKVHELLSAFSNDDLIMHLYLRNLREEVKKRDNYECQECKRKK